MKGVTMVDTLIACFLGRVKKEWLRGQVKPTTKEEKINKLKQDADGMFSQKWLAQVITNLSFSKDIGRLKYTTHSPKFSHPDVKLDAVNYTPKVANPFVATGSVVCVNLDMYSNSGAAYLKKDYIYVYEFLTSKLQDSRMVMEHLREPTPEIRSVFEQLNLTEQFDDIRKALVELASLNQLSISSEKITQVYFPVDNDYHLLSLLSPSPLMSQLKTRVNDLNYSDTNKEARVALKNKTPIKSELNEIFNLTKIGYGGANKQNISVLNNKDGGYFYLLSSLPPNLSKRKVQPPKKDFFDDCLWDGLFQNDFEAFHEVLTWRKNNKGIRDKRDDIVLNSMAKLRRLIAGIRDIGAGWSDSDTYESLLRWQKVWLDEKNEDIRNDKSLNDDYLTKAKSYFANWFINHYKDATKDNKLLGDDDIEHIKKILKDEQELLK